MPNKSEIPAIIRSRVLRIVERENQRNAADWLRQQMGLTVYTATKRVRELVAAQKAEIAALRAAESRRVGVSPVGKLSIVPAADEAHSGSPGRCVTVSVKGKRNGGGV